MAIDVAALAAQMSNAALPILKSSAPSIGGYVQGECAKIAQTIATIESERAASGISDDEAKLLLEMQKGAMRSVLLSAEGLGLLAVEKAINAALDAVKPIVNVALGFALL